MKLKDYGYKERTIKVRTMSMAEMRVGVIKGLFEKRYHHVNIRLMNLTCGEVETFSSTEEFLLADFNESWEINLLDVKGLDIYNESSGMSEKTIIILTEDAEEHEDTMATA